MVLKTATLKPVAFAILCVAAGSSHADLTVYTSQASFLAAVTNPGVDTYTGFNINGSTPSPITRNAGDYAYTASVSTTSFFGAGTTADPWLSTNTATDTITFTGFSGGASAIGGNFFTSDILGQYALGSVTLTATDSLGVTSTQTITNSTTGSFLGFVSTGTLVSLTLSAVQPATPIWPTVDNLTLAVAAPVPEPETYALLMAGLGVIGFLARRRRS